MGFRAAAFAALASHVALSEFARDIERPGLHAKERIGLYSAQRLLIGGQIALPLRIEEAAVVHADIPARQYVAPLHAPAYIHSVRRRSPRIARGANEHVERERRSEPVAVIEHADAEQRAPADVICLEGDTQVLMRRYHAAGAQSEVGPRLRLRVIRSDHMEVDLGAVVVRACADVELVAIRAVARESGGFGIVVAPPQ